jgi:hypothetical protein
VTKRDDGGPAFPRPDWNGSWIGPDSFSGMTLRDWFAGQAMLPAFLLALEAVKANPRGAKFDETDLAEGAYKFADAMLAERSK